MVTLQDRRSLASLRNEAERQSEFYGSRGDEVLARIWGCIAEEATLAIQTNRWLLMNIREAVTSPIPIKACEQGQQLTNTNTTKAIR